MYPDFPDEVWSRVFFHLPEQDRKCVRLTCHRFHSACNTSIVQSSEQITRIFYRSRKSKLENNTMSFQPFLNIDRKVWNFKIDGMKLIDNFASEFFEKWGTRVHSLVFHDCVFAPGFLQGVIAQCPSLRRIVLKFSNTCNDADTSQSILDDLVSLQTKDIVRSRVRDLTLQLPQRMARSLTNLKFLCFFSVFPNVRNLNLSIGVDRNFDSESADSTSDTQFSFRCVYNQLLKMSDQLERLALHFFGNTVHDSRYEYSTGTLETLRFPENNSVVSTTTLRKFARIEIKNLKELSLYWSDNPRTEVFYKTNPFSGFEHLTHFHARITVHVPLFYFIKILLDTAKELRTLFIHNTDDRDHYLYYIEMRCFTALLQSKLSTLNLAFRNHGTSIHAASHMLSQLNHRPMSPNRTLKSLTLHSADRKIWALFLKYFRNLDTLEFPKLRPEALNNLCEYQSELRSLKVSNNHHLIDTSKLEEWLQIGNLEPNRQLQHLTHLHIEEKDSSLSCTEFMADGLVFPKLESLSIDCRPNLLTDQIINVHRFGELIGKFPQIQNVRLSTPFEMILQQWLTLIEALPKLRILRISDEATSPMPISDCQQFFEIRSSLSTVYHNGVTYYKNFSTKSIESL